MYFLLCAHASAARDDCFLGNGSTPCLNGGVCVDEVGGYTCNCTEDFVGQDCCCPIAPNGTVPMIMMEPDNQEVSIFGSANFTCLATGEPPPTYSWFKVTKLIKPRIHIMCVSIATARAHDDVIMCSCNMYVHYSVKKPRDESHPLPSLLG